MLDVRPEGEHHFHRVPGEDLQLSQARLIVGIGAGDQQHAVIDSNRQQRVSTCVGTIDQGDRPDLARGVIQIDGVRRRPAARDERLDGGTDGCPILNHSNIMGIAPVSGNGNRPTSWSLLSRPGRVLTWDKAAMARRMRPVAPAAERNSGGSPQNVQGSELIVVAPLKLKHVHGVLFVAINQR